MAPRGAAEAPEALQLVAGLAREARAAARVVAMLGPDAKNRALIAAAARLRDDGHTLIGANTKDIASLD